MGFSYVGLGVLLAKGHEAVHKAEERGGKILADTARADAPVLSGEYQASIQADGGVVTAGTDHGLYVEVGTSDTPDFAVLERALLDTAPRFREELAKASREVF